jgi:hypothetical protein
MQRRSIPFALQIAAGCVEFSDSENSLWMATEAGEVVTCRLLDSRVRIRGGGYLQPVSVLPAPDGLKAEFADRDAEWDVSKRQTERRCHFVRV